jgi:hypothetical protein
MAETKTADQKRLKELQRLGYAQVDLLVINGPGRGVRYGLKAGGNILGRATDADVVLDEGEVSRRHARIRIGNELELEDLGSAVGTILNGRMMMGRDFLFDNDEIRIASSTMRLEVKRRESRRGILVAALCLLAAVGVLAAALVYPDQIRALSATAATKPSDQRPQTQEGASWRNWETLRLPDLEGLQSEGIEVDPASAEAQYDYATRLYDGRFGDLRNPYQALLYYKRALAILRHIEPLEARPAIANRSLERIRDLQQMIRSDMEKRVFAFQRYYRQEWWSRCFRALNEMMQICPWPGDRYHRWAAGRNRDLRRALQR